MAKTKLDWLKEAKELGLKVDSSAKIADIKELIESQSKGTDTDPASKGESEGKSTTAKAGKRSAKAVREADEKEAKTERKAEDKVEPQPKKKPAKPARSRLERRGKKYKEKAKLIDKDKEYSLKNALDLAVKTSPSKFDASIELHIRLNVDPKQADQNIRDSVVLPSGTGKTAKVAVVADDDAANKAKSAGAYIAGGDKIFSQLDKETIDFDVLIAEPDMMAKLSKYARLLGPKGLMPNPKSGTVTKNIDKALKEALAGKVEYRVDSNGIAHLAIGKASFGPDKLAKNAEAIMSSIKAQKPASIKGAYGKNLFVSSSMGPSIRVNISGLF